MNIDNLVKYILEIKQLLITPRTGWDFIGKERAETIAHHSLQAAITAYLITQEEKKHYPHVSPQKALCVSLFHDTPEIRTGDLNNVYKKYFPNKREAEEKAFRDQISRLNPDLRLKLSRYRWEFESGSTPEGAIVKDADKLQMADQAAEFLSEGFALSQRWIDSGRNGLRTEIAKKIAEKMASVNPGYFSIKPEIAHERFLIGILAFILTDTKTGNPEESAFCALFPLTRLMAKMYAKEIGLEPPVNSGMGFTETALATAEDAHNLQFLVRAAKNDNYLNLTERQINYIAAQIKTNLAQELAARFMSPEIKEVVWWE